MEEQGKQYRLEQKHILGKDEEEIEKNKMYEKLEQKHILGKDWKMVLLIHSQ